MTSRFFFALLTLSFMCSLSPESEPKSTTPTKESISIDIQKPAQANSTAKCLALVVGSHKLLHHVAHIVQDDLEWSDQISIELKRYEHELTDHVLGKLSEQGFCLCLYIEEIPQKKKSSKECHINVILKDPSTGAECFKKTFVCHENKQVYDAHCISDELIPVLTDQKGPMLSSLAYCKQLSSRHKVVCISDYSCKTERTVVLAKTTNVAPCWHSKAPVLFYSQFTRSNSRLMSYDLRTKNHKVICSYDGLNMQPSFSPDGSKAVICLSEKGNSELYVYDQADYNRTKKRMFKQLTFNKGNNSSPCLLPNGNIVFCSDFQTGSPQIYLFDIKKNATSRLTSGQGYCASPCYCAQTNSIAYTRYANGIFQIFSMNLGTTNSKEKQLTFSAGDKVEPTMSECGRFIAFTYGDRDPKSGKIINQIAALNRTSGKMRILTTGKEHKSFPSWTSRPLYAVA